jgi:hypothetical protein
LGDRLRIKARATLFHEKIRIISQETIVARGNKEGSINLEEVGMKFAQIL